MVGPGEFKIGNSVPLEIRKGLTDAQFKGSRNHKTVLGGRAGFSSSIATIAIADQSFASVMGLFQKCVGVQWQGELGVMWCGGGDDGQGVTARGGPNGNDTKNDPISFRNNDTALAGGPAINPFGGCYASMWGRQNGDPKGKGVWILGGGLGSGNPSDNASTAAIASSLDGGRTHSFTTFPDVTGSNVLGFSYDLAAKTFLAAVIRNSGDVGLGTMDIKTSANGVDWGGGPSFPIIDANTIIKDVPGLLNQTPTLETAKVARLGGVLPSALGSGTLYAAGELGKEQNPTLAKIQPFGSDGNGQFNTITLSPLGKDGLAGAITAPFPGVQAITIAGGFLWVAGYDIDRDNLHNSNLQYAFTDGTSGFRSIAPGFSTPITEISGGDFYVCTLCAGPGTFEQLK